MSTPLRAALVAAGVLSLLLAAAFFVQWPAALRLWPWPGGRLSNVFIASILAASGVPVLWIGLTAETAAIAGGALNFALMYGGMAAVSLMQAGDPAARYPLLPFALACAVLALGCALLFGWSRRLPFSDERPLPPAVRWAFAAFVPILLAAGIALLMAAPAVFPWRLSAPESRLFGCVFLGAACYFGYALAKPRWKNAQGPLLGFLAYDLVLIGPFAGHFARVDPALLPSLVVYSGVIVASALVALQALFTQRDASFVR